MDRLMKETETLQHQAKVFKIDADQFAMALQQQQVRVCGARIMSLKFSGPTFR